MSDKAKKLIKQWLPVAFLLFGSAGVLPLFSSLRPHKDNSHPNIDIKSSQISLKQGVLGNVSTVSGSVYIINGQPEDEKKSKPVKSVSLAPDIEVTGKSGFFQRAYGTLAVLPNTHSHLTAINSNNFLILSPGKQNKIKDMHSPLWLQFNHHSADADGKRKHLGIMVVTFGHMGSIMPLEVYRNKNWKRPNKKQILGEFREVIDKPWPDFMASIQEWKSPSAQIEDSDKVVKGPWQAMPQGGDKISWEFRKFWPWAAAACQETAKKVLGADENFENVKVSTRLIGYTPTPLLTSHSPVIFNINSIPEENGAAFVAIYALQDTDEDLSYWYWLRN